MAKKEKRFVRIHKETAMLTVTELLVDRQTGVTYLWHTEGNAGGITALLDANGRPVISKIPREDLD